MLAAALEETRTESDDELPWPGIQIYETVNANEIS